MNINWKWPETEHNKKVPWYTVIRRVVFIVPVFLFLFISLAFVYLGWGKRVFVDMWRDVV